MKDTIRTDIERERITRIVDTASKGAVAVLYFTHTTDAVWKVRVMSRYRMGATIDVVPGDAASYEQLRMKVGLLA